MKTLLLMLSTVVALTTAPDALAERESPFNRGKMSDELKRMFDSYERNGERGISEEAKRCNGSVKSKYKENLIAVVVEPFPGKDASSIDLSWFTKKGIDVDSVAKTFVRLYVSGRLLKKLLEHPNVHHSRIWRCNRAPVLDPIGSKSVDENTLLTFVLKAWAPDADPITITALSMPEGATLVDNRNGTGSFSFKPTYSQAGTYMVTFIAAAKSLADSEKVAITVKNVNTAPVLAAIPDQQVNEAQPLGFAVSATDPENAALTIVVSPLPAGAAFTDNGNGTAAFSWIPTYEQSGSYSIKVTASDGLLADSRTVSIKVTDVNRTPVIAAIGSKSVDETETLSFTVMASDPDGTTPALSASPLPAGATFEDGLFSWTPTYSQAGAYTVAFSSSDGSLEASETISITVNNTNRVPVLSAIGAKSVNEGQTLAFTVLASDPDGTFPGFTATGLPSGAKLIDNGDGTAQFSWTPGYEQAGTFTINMQASDGEAVSTEEARVTVSNTNRKPIITTSPFYSVPPGKELSISITGSDHDFDEVSLAASGTPLSLGALFTDRGQGCGTCIWTPDTANLGSYDMRFFVSDGQLHDSVSLKIMVSKTMSGGLVGRWKFDEGSGTIAIDGSGRSNSGVLSGGVAYSEFVPPALRGSSTKSLLFDGVNGFVSANNVGNYDNYTISTWIKIAGQTSPYSCIVQYGGTKGLIELYNGNSIYFTLITKARVQYTVPLVAIDTGWHHIAAVLNADTMQLYIDGQMQSSTVKNGVGVDGATLQMGLENSSRYPYKGLVDDVRIYNRPLNSKDIGMLSRSDINLPPVVYAGCDTFMNNVSMAMDLALRGSVFDDRLSENQLQFHWREITGSPKVSFVGGTAGLSTLARFSAAGEYVLELGVCDGETVGYDSMTVMITDVSTDLSSGLAGRWELDEGSGSMAIDGSGRGHNGTLSGGGSYSDIVPAVLSRSSIRSMLFDGTNGCVTANNVGMYEAYTLSSWIKTGTSKSDSSAVVAYGNRRGMISVYQGNSVGYELATAAGQQFRVSAVSIDTGWHHVAAVLMADTMRLFVDGKMRSTTIKTGALNSGEIMQIGMETGSATPFKGFVDDVRLYSRALNNQEIQTLWAYDVNLPPGVNAGRDTMMADMFLPADLVLSGSAIDDRLPGKQLVVQWREITGSPNVSFVGDGTALSTTAIFSAAGEYKIELGVSDGEAAGYDSVIVMVLPAPPIDLSSNLACHWKMDEGSGSAAIDASGNSHNGTFSGGVAYSNFVPPALKQISSKSLSFDGVNGFVSANNVGNYDNYTISTWIKIAGQTSPYTCIVQYGGTKGLIELFNGSSIYFTLITTARVQYTVPPVSIDTGWHHIAAVLNADTMQLYIDGQMRSTRVKNGVAVDGATLQMGLENSSRYPYKGLVDDVRLYGRALKSAEVQGLAKGPVAEAAFVFKTDFTNLACFTDLSRLIPWGGIPTGTSAFIVDTVFSQRALFLSQPAMANSGTVSSKDLKTFSALDYVFPREIGHDTEIVSVEFNARWDSTSLNNDTSFFSVILMDNYPTGGVSGADLTNFSGNPYGTPALTAKLRPGLGSSKKSFLQYGGTGSGSFDKYDNQWWLPGSVSPTAGSASMVIGAGDEYPLSSWRSTSAVLGDTVWARYKYQIRPDRQELYRNDTLLGMMELPASSFVAPGYRYYYDLKAMRLAWTGGAQCYVSDLHVSAEPYTAMPNLSPAVSLVHPAGDTAVPAGSGAYILARANDEDGAINRVEFYSNGEKLGVDYSAPYEFSWQAVPRGSNWISAFAIDDKGAVTVAKVVTMEGN